MDAVTGLELQRPMQPVLACVFASRENSGIISLPLSSLVHGHVMAG